MQCKRHLGDFLYSFIAMNFEFNVIIMMINLLKSPSHDLAKLLNLLTIQLTLVYLLFINIATNFVLIFEINHSQEYFIQLCMYIEQYHSISMLSNYLKATMCE